MAKNFPPTPNRFACLPIPATNARNNRDAKLSTVPAPLSGIFDNVFSPINSSSNTPTQTMPISIAKSPDTAGYSITVLHLS